MSEDQKKPSKRTFVPAETWVLPARRPTTKPARDEEDVAKKGEPDKTRTRVVLQAGCGLCVSFVLAACGSRDNRPTHVGPPLGDTHVSQGPSDPTVPPPDAADYDQPSRGLPISAPIGNAPIQPSERQPQVPAQAPTSDQQQPGVFSPPPPSENQPDASQPQIPQPAPPSTTPLPQDQPE